MISARSFRAAVERMLKSYFSKGSMVAVHPCIISVEQQKRISAGQEHCPFCGVIGTDNHRGY